MEKQNSYRIHTTIVYNQIEFYLFFMQIFCELLGSSVKIYYLDIFVFPLKFQQLLKNTC